MPRDTIKAFQAAREAVLRERQRHLIRLREIERALGKMDGAKTRAPRAANSMNIREAISKVTAKRPLSIREIVQAVQDIGYQFSSTNPVNSLGAYLYSATGKREFGRKEGKFFPAK